ncbi:hypothetical protein GDO81_015339 [Engystomops pustulosus]|uniref:Pre-mRNA-processing factor 39 n=1 Tax=Engystomops pustulosus TaxID=76066 RepID=A0AAV7AIN8_ENGPU|nr:hypothetical protein GDO81_015339 [Engystomops pustulosus]
MQDPKPDPSPVIQDSEEKAKPPAEASQSNKDILEVTAMEQSPEQDATSEVEEAAEPPEKVETEPEPPLPPEFDKYWKAVEANPEDFTTWTYLLHYIEQERTTEVENMRHRIIEVHQEIFSLNENEVHKRWTFEEGIKRPYFHVKALEKVQINNWKEYLDFEIENGAHERVVILFERCVIACACYEEFWIKYAKYMENHSPEGARHVYNRACNIHLLRKPLAHLLWAAFEEQQGNIEDAKRILKTLEESVDGLAMVRLRRVNLERRHGNIKEAEELLTEAMKNAKTTHESSFYAIKLSRFYLKNLKNVVKAKKVLTDALQKDKENTRLYLNLIDLEFSGDVKQNEGNILVLFDKVIKSSLPLTTKITFSQRKVEFLEDFGSDINKLLTTYDEHQRLLREQEIQKRKAENGLEHPDAKRLHTEDGAVMAAPMAATATAAAAQPAYNYANWYQVQSLPLFV